MIVKNTHEIWISAIPFAIIAVIIFIFNIISIWGFDGLLIDDQGYYFKLYDKSISDLTFKRNILHSLFTLGIIKILILTSAFFARILIILLLCIPSAYLIYYFSHKRYKLAKPASIAIAVFPFILPNEVQVPTYLAGSYILLAILFALVSIYFMLNFSRKSAFSFIDFILAVSFYYLATESSELIASMLPVFLFLIFIFRKLSVKQLILGALISFIAVRKAILIINHPHGKINSVSNDLSVTEIIYRIAHFMDFMNPLYGMSNILILNIILVCVIVLAVIIVFKNHNRVIKILDSSLYTGELKNKYYYFTYYLLFPLVWMAFSAIPFIFFSQSFTSRYFSVTSIAFCFILVVSISIIYGFFSNRKIPLIIIFMLMIAFSGYNRQKNFKSSYQIQNDQYDNLQQTLATSNFTEDAQIIVAGPDHKWLSMGYGITNKSIGTLQYTLQRRDVKGQIMNEKNFYDPFQIHNMPWTYPCMDIDTTKNTWLFRCFNIDTSKNRRLYYALRWVDEKSKESPWSLFHFDEQGMITNLTSGIGYNSYEITLDSLSATGIKRDDILFGGIPTRKDSLRLGL